MAKRIKFQNSILCEHAIIGVNNKHTLVNLYSGGIIASTFPAQLTLGVYIELFPLINKDNSFTLDVKLGRQLIGNVKGKFDSTDNDQPSVIIIPLINIRIEKEVDFIVVARADGYAATTVLKKHISQGNVGQTIAPNALPQPS